MLPNEARTRTWVIEEARRLWFAHGYEPIVLPLFEYERVLAPAWTHETPLNLHRFVDPRNGEVAVLAPDITPQIGRLVATRLRDRPLPYRLSYEATVLRQPLGRARTQRQFAQIGIECIGVESSAADAEVIELASGILERVGLNEHKIELGYPHLARMALLGLPQSVHDEAIEALSRKDRAPLLQLAKQCPGSNADLLSDLSDLWGDRRVIEEARAVFAAHEVALAQLDRLEALVERLNDRGLAPRLVFDLGEVRGFDYYTGPRFQCLAEGPGEPLGGGGRYDALLGAFGVDLPATGAALDLDHVAWALAASGTARVPSQFRVVVATLDRERELANSLRAQGEAVSEIEGDLTRALAFCRAWDHQGAVAVGSDRIEAVRMRDGAERTFPLGEREHVKSALRAFLRGTA